MSILKQKNIIIDNANITTFLFTLHIFHLFRFILNIFCVVSVQIVTASLPNSLDSCPLELFTAVLNNKVVRSCSLTSATAAAAAEATEAIAASSVTPTRHHHDHCIFVTISG